MKENILNQIKKEFFDHIFLMTFYSSFFISSILLIISEKILKSFHVSTDRGLFLAWIVMIILSCASLFIPKIKKLIYSLAERTERYQRANKIENHVYYKNGFVFTQNFKSFKLIDYKDQVVLLEGDNNHFREVRLKDFFDNYLW